MKPIHDAFNIQMAVRNGLFAALGGVLLSWQTPLQAQEGAQSTQQSNTEQPAAAGGETGGIEEIMVTAQKTTENIQDVPFSVSAVTGASLEKFQYKDLKDLNGAVPNVQFTQ